jgi:hypothetical protein
MKRLLLACALVIVATVGRADTGCLDGDYAVAGDPLLSSPTGAFAPDVVTIAGDTIAIASGCPAVAFRARTTVRGTVLRAVWAQCGAAGPARMRAVVGKTCRAMRGLFASGGPRTFRRFVARHEGSCRRRVPIACPCRTSGDCATRDQTIRADAAYCAKPQGRCDALGLCQARPTHCPLSILPACGCDGVTYAGPCEAAQHGVAVAHPRACDRTVCGGVAGIPCGTGEFCELPKDECDGVDLQGVCIDVPQSCPDFYAPVCGCDGATYSNDCDRQMAGVQRAHEGTCEKECSDACDCARTRTFPEPCPLECATCDNYWTCDDGACVPHCGPVPQPPPNCEKRVCGGIAGIGCPDGEVCELPAGECHGADLQGVCVPKPGGCVQVYDPVCGCDGTTYGNDCERRAKGAQKAHDGPCGAACATRCDCYASAKLPAWCDALACPACGCVWQCDAGECAVHVETPPGDPACG